MEAARKACMRAVRMEDGATVHPGAVLIGADGSVRTFYGVTSDGHVLAGREQLEPSMFHLMIVMVGVAS